MVLDNHRASLLTRNGKCYSVQRARIPPLFDIDDLTYYNESVGNVNPPNPEQSTIIRNCNGGTFLYDNSKGSGFFGNRPVFFLTFLSLEFTKKHYMINSEGK